MDPVTASYLRRCYRHNVRSRELPRIRFRALNDNLDPAFAAWREGILNNLSEYRPPSPPIPDHTGGNEAQPPAGTSGVGGRGCFCALRMAVNGVFHNRGIGDV